MKIFIQGRKDGYNTLYPKPTPAEFFQFASDIQRIDAQNNTKYYGKSLYAIAFNGNGCIFTKHIVGYDTLRSSIGNIGISVFIPNNQKMLGADIKTLLDDLINIYTSNYCPDFKINNQKQEDWLLFQLAADNYEKNNKLKTISSDEIFQYGNRDAAYVIYNNIDEIEKYLDSPYQAEYKEYKQIFFIENQSQLILEVIKHDQTANLTGKIDLENPSYKLREYHGIGKDGVLIEIRANGILRRGGEKIFRKDNISIKYSKKYFKDILEEGKLSDPQIAKYLKIVDNTVDVEKNIELKPTEIPVEISINDSKGNKINNAIITCKNNYSKIEKPVSQNTIVFSGEEQKDRWTISAKKDDFLVEETFIPDYIRIVKLTLREVKNLKIQVISGDTILKTENRTFYDDDIRKEQTEVINMQGYQTKKITFIPNDKFDVIPVPLEKQVNQQPIPPGPKEVGSNSGTITKPPIKRPYIKILIASSIACLLVVGVCFLVKMDLLGNGTDDKGQPRTNPVLPKLTSNEIKNYVEGDCLFLDRLKTYKDEWEMLKDSTDSIEYTEYNDCIDRAIKKREAINSRDFVFFKDSSNAVRYDTKQLDFKNAVFKIKPNQVNKVKTELGDVSKLTLTEIAVNIVKILEDIKIEGVSTNTTSLKTSTLSNTEDTEKEKNEKATAAKKAEEAAAKAQAKGNTVNNETVIINYLLGDEYKISTLSEFLNNPDISDKLKKSIELAIKFWKLDGESRKTYVSYKKDFDNDRYLMNNNKLKNFLNNTPNTAKYPKFARGAGATITLGEFIDQQQPQ